MKKIPKSKSVLEETFALQIRAMKLPKPKREYKFHHKRKWRVDFAWPELAVAVEVEGGIRPFYQWQKGKRVKVERGRHLTPQGYQDDIDKYNAAVEEGYSLYRVTREMIKDGRAIAQLERVLK